MSRQSRLNILLTRPDAQSRRFADDLGLGDITISPLMVPQFIDAARPLGEFAAVIFTSETAVQAAWPGLPRRAYCVGTRTAAAAKGFAVQVAQGDWRDLFDLIRADPPQGRLLFLHAAESKPDLAAALNAAGIETVSQVAYRQVEQDLTAQAVALLQGADAVIVPLFSARSARLFCDAYRRAGCIAPLWIAAMSRQVADAVTLPAQVRIARHPDAGQMREMVLELARRVHAS